MLTKNAFLTNFHGSCNFKFETLDKPRHQGCLENLVLPHSNLPDRCVGCYMLYHDYYDIVWYDIKQYCLICNR